MVDLEVVERSRMEEQARAAQRRVTLQLAAKRCGFRIIPAVDEWDCQYDEILERYKFLVLDGPSKTGKTIFARSRCPQRIQVYEINCAAGGEPDFRDYVWLTHGLILCDEIEAEAVAAQRKLFQAAPCFVQLGTSPTNIHVYKVFVHRVRIVCASNNWVESLARLTPADRAWVVANSVHVVVDSPLWQ